MEDHRDRRARLGSGGETPFEAAFGTGEDDFGHMPALKMGGAVERGKLRAI
jgi:hypothetical protein